MPVTFDLDKSSAMGTTTKFTENQVAADDISRLLQQVRLSRVIYDPAKLQGPARARGRINGKAPGYMYILYMHTIYNLRGAKILSPLPSSPLSFFRRGYFQNVRKSATDG